MNVCSTNLYGNRYLIVAWWSYVWIWNGQKCHRKWILDIQNGRSIWNGQKYDPKWFSDIQNGSWKKKSVSNWNGQNCGNPKWPIDLEWLEMHRKWILDIQNGWPQPFCQKFPNKIKVAFRSEMARNAIESEFRTSKMADVSHFVKNFKKKSVSMWNG